MERDERSLLKRCWVERHERSSVVAAGEVCMEELGRERERLTQQQTRVTVGQLQTAYSTGQHSQLVSRTLLMPDDATLGLEINTLLFSLGSRGVWNAKPGTRALPSC